MNRAALGIPLHRFPVPPQAGRKNSVPISAVVEHLRIRSDALGAVITNRRSAIRMQRHAVSLTRSGSGMRTS